MGAGISTGKAALPLSPAINAFIAASRFGFGARGDDLAAIGHDPLGWLAAQLEPALAANASLDNLSQTIETLAPFRNILKNKPIIHEDTKNDADVIDMLQQTRQKTLDRYVQEIAVRMDVAAQSQTPFFERLVHFWSNHFTVSARKWGDVPLVVTFERDCIRPHIMGSFEDMLVAVTKSPAMQIYLDNVRSVGPNSPGGRLKDKGLNENLAREIMELHTLGVGGGYTQADVTEFAKMLTGWTVDAQDRGDGSGFFFARMIHEPGDKVLLGQTYRENGEGEVLSALRTFATHPSTAKFIATKLARHFVADEPSAMVVSKIASAFMRSNGNLMVVYKTILAMEEVWLDPLPKIKTPNDYILSLIRAADVDAGDEELIGAYKTLGQIPFTAGSPAGWSDRAKDWIGAEALLQRIDLAKLIARGVYTKTDPNVLLAQTIGPVASAETKFAVAHAGSAADALTLLFASPEFQRR